MSIEVTVYDRDGEKSLPCYTEGCGECPSWEETTKSLSIYLRTAYGGAVEVEYIDLADPARHEEFKQILQAAEEYNWPYPLVAVEGALKMAGGIDVELISNEIEKVMAEQDETKSAFT